MIKPRKIKAIQIERVIKEYFNLLVSKNYKKIIGLFSSNARINSPLYGKVKAKNFYKELFKDTSKFKITLIDIFKSKKNPLVAAGYFHNDWLLKKRMFIPFNRVNIFRFTEKGKIKELTIIYDTSKIRLPFEKMKK